MARHRSPRKPDEFLTQYICVRKGVLIRKHSGKKLEAAKSSPTDGLSGDYARIARLMSHFSSGNDVSKSVGVERSRPRRAATAGAGSPDAPPRPIYSMYCLFELVLNEHEWMTDSTLDIQIGSANSENGRFVPWTVWQFSFCTNCYHGYSSVLIKVLIRPPFGARSLVGGAVSYFACLAPI
jgi:hypothetical protein